MEKYSSESACKLYFAILTGISLSRYDRYSQHEQTSTLLDKTKSLLVLYFAYGWHTSVAGKWIANGTRSFYVDHG